MRVMRLTVHIFSFIEEELKTVAEQLPSWTDRALSGGPEKSRSGVATFGTSEKECTMGAEGASRRWRWAMELIIVHFSEAASLSCASPASHM